MDDRFFTIDEVAKYLKIPKSTLYKLSEKGKIPSVKIGKQLRFRKSSLNQWLSEKENQSDKDINAKAKNILLVDDDTLVLKTVGKLLRMHGYNVEPAESGEEALKKVGNCGFDLIIADVRMPGIDGIQTIQEIRQLQLSQNRSSIPEIIITGYMDTQKQQEAERLGITDYIYKPFATVDFIRTVKEKFALCSN